MINTGYLSKLSYLLIHLTALSTIIKFIGQPLNLAIRQFDIKVSETQEIVVF